MRRLLKLQPHQHTGKPLPHRHTSYRVLALLLLMVGIFLAWAGWGIRQVAVANAEELYVSARVPAPIPSEPAVILHPSDGTVTNKPEITVSGTCPVTDPPVSVAIQGNGRLLGSTTCLDNGTFSLQVTLLLGKTTLVARTLTITDDYGPDSAPVTVTYTPESESPFEGGTSIHNKPGGTTTGGGQSSQKGEALIINSRKPFILFSPHKLAEWVGWISGGTPPYEITIDWGDGDLVTYKHLDSEEHTFSHRYEEMRPYAVQLEARDSSGAHTSAVFAAGTPYVPPASNLLLPHDYNIDIDPRMLIGLYGGYLSLLCIVGVLWLHAHHSGYTRLAPARVAMPARSKKRASKPLVRHRR